MRVKIQQHLRRGGRLLCQLLFFIVAWVGADALARHYGSPIPGAVWGLGATLGLLYCGALPAATVAAGARWLLAEMLLFFVPLFMEMAGNLGLFAREGARLAGAVLLGTVIVMAGTAWVVDRVYIWEKKRAAARERKEGSL
jgi:holin-like protein